MSLFIRSFHSLPKIQFLFQWLLQPASLRVRKNFLCWKYEKEKVKCESKTSYQAYMEKSQTYDKQEMIGVRCMNIMVVLQKIAFLVHHQLGQFIFCSYGFQSADVKFLHNDCTHHFHSDSLCFRTTSNC